MDITFQPDGATTAPIILAQDKRGTGVWTGPSNPRRDGQRVVQTVQPVGAPRVTHHSRKNRSGTLSFGAKCTCADEAAAVKLVTDYDDSLPIERGTLTVGGNAITGALITSVSTYNTGVTVYANLTLIF